MKILDTLWKVGGGHLSGPEDAAVYLARFGPKAALFDAGTGTGHKRLVNTIRNCLPEGVDIEYLFLTHCHFDHTGGAEALRQQFGCKIAAHRLDAGYLETGDSTVTAASWYGSRMAPLSIDYRIEHDRDSIPVGNGQVEALHCPGHSPGSVVYLMHIESRTVLIGQDIHGPLHPSLLSNREDYIRSLNLLLQLNADILCEGHFGVFQGRKKVRDFIESYLT